MLSPKKQSDRQIPTQNFLPPKPQDLHKISKNTAQTIHQNSISSNFHKLGSSNSLQNGNEKFKIIQNHKNYWFSFAKKFNKSSKINKFNIIENNEAIKKAFRDLRIRDSVEISKSFQKKVAKASEAQKDKPRFFIKDLNGLKQKVQIKIISKKQNEETRKKFVLQTKIN